MKKISFQTGFTGFTGFWPRKRGGLGACPQLLILLILLILSKNSLAAPLQWTCNWPDARPQTFSLYQGETATFEPTFRVNGHLVTNATIEAVWYQTNGMNNAWWRLDNATFAPSNDVGAASYRFFVEASIPQSNNPNNSNNQTILYRANGTLRMLPSPGFTPNAIEPPVVALDFAAIEIANAPWLEEETDPTVPAWAKEATPPLPPDYAAVSNLAYGAALAAEVPRFAQAATNYTDAATNALAQSSASAFMPASFTETDPTISSWAKAASKPSYTASEVGATTAEDVYRLIAGTNVVLVVTNYNSSVHAPSMKLQHLDPQSGEYVTYWDETRRHGMTLTNAMNYTDAAIGTCAPAAWSGTTSGLGQEAPAGVTWISTPETVVAGGFEYEKIVTSAGNVWVLTSNGLYTGPTTNSYFRVAAADGTELFSIEKTDSYLIGVNADGITKSGNTVTIPVNVVASEHPYLRASRNLVNADWVKEDENGFSCPWASVSWSGTTGAYVATITTSEPQAFFYFEYLVEGSAKIKNSAKTDLSGGIIFNGTTYFPTVNGNKLEFVAQ